MSNPIVLLSPLVNVIVTGLFAGVLLRQYMSRHRPHQLYWSSGLVMAFVATLAYVLMIVMQPVSPAGVIFFRVYYLLGAALVPAWLGLGSIALVSSQRLTRICFFILVALSLLAALLIFTASIDMGKLSQIAGTPGTGTLQQGAWLLTIIVLNTLGVVAVVGVAIYSGWKLVRRQSDVAGLHTSNVLWANMLILIGDMLNALAGTLARVLGLQSTFWLIMALGWVVFFIGVVLASRRPNRVSPPVPQQDATHPIHV